jgi:hypothetical protein
VGGGSGEEVEELGGEWDNRVEGESSAIIGSEEGSIILLKQQPTNGLD